jgi:predicted dithiol-disulfide oxidoreductase (DUF899 family)
MAAHKVGTREEWLKARDALLEREKELTRRGDELTKERLELPWVPIEKDYSFATDDGPKTLAELFDGRTQLIVYHHMFGPTYEAGCPMCSTVSDSFDAAIPHLQAKDVTFVCMSRAPLEKLQAYKKRMGWKFPWVSSHDSDFNLDFQASATEEQVRPIVDSGQLPAVVDYLAETCGTDPAGYISEQPVLNVFALDEGVVYQTYATTARGLEFTLGYYGFLDRAPFGRNENDPQFWQRRHDEY